MNNVIGKLAILFAGFIVAGVFLNLYMLAISFMLIPMLISLRLNFGFTLRGSEVYGPAYWVCLAAGVITAFFIMRPAWLATEKRPRKKGEPEEEAPKE